MQDIHTYAGKTIPCLRREIKDRGRKGGREEGSNKERQKKRKSKGERKGGRHTYTPVLVHLCHSSNALLDEKDFYTKTNRQKS